MRKSVHEQEEVKLSITPMIDVTFLLLIFFMCAMKFKTLERKVAAFLPTDRGPAKTVQLFPPETKITVKLRWDEGTRATRVKLLDSEIGMDDPAFVVLDQRLAAIRGNPDNVEMPGELDAGAEVPHADVVRCVDSFMKAGITNLRFRGAPPPGRE
jgi:biopolymer transport protein ExbD